MEEEIGKPDPDQTYDPLTAPMKPDSPPPAKRRKLDVSLSSLVQDGPLSAAEIPRNHSVNDSSFAGAEFPRTTWAGTAASMKPKPGTQTPDATRRMLATSKPTTMSTPAAIKQPSSVTRPVSPPNLHAAKKDASPRRPSRKPTIVEDYKPRKVEKSPALFSKRFEYIEKFKKMIGEANARMRKEFPNEPDLLLSEEEIKMQAMDEEERAANANPNADSYRSALGQRLMYFSQKKMSPAEWKTFINTTWLITPDSKNEATTNEPPKIESGLDSVGKEIAVLKLLRCGLSQYQGFGYITKAPTKKEIEDAQKTMKTMANTEICDRCTTRFQVFPGRNSAGELTTRGTCHYHWARMPMFRGNNATYPCCKGVSGSTGCTESPTHVFKTSEPARLALILPFEETVRHNDGKKRQPVTFDCEMAYTTHGMELIRVTAISWPTKQTLLDILVRPIGEILDLNTRFSGVTPELFTSAPEFGHVPPPKYLPGEPLQKVASPKAARDLLFDFLDPETPLIGHAIDNDLNACRIIHPFVIDTVLLYPHPKGLPVKYKLRDLASMNLGRKIQQGGDQGHDSKEDSDATADLVLVQVKKKWETMKNEGWTWKGDAMIPPVRRSASTIR